MNLGTIVLSDAWVRGSSFHCIFPEDLDCGTMDGRQETLEHLLLAS